MNGEEKLTEQQLEFVSRELGLTEECAAIEVEETIKAGDGELSQRGVMAVEMVDLIHGPYSEDE